MAVDDLTHGVPYDGNPRLPTVIRQKQRQARRTGPYATHRGRWLRSAFVCVPVGLAVSLYLVWRFALVPSIARGESPFPMKWILTYAIACAEDHEQAFPNLAQGQSPGRLADWTDQPTP